MSQCYDNCRSRNGYLSKNRLICCKRMIDYTNDLDHGDCEIDDIIMDIQHCDGKEINTMKNEKQYIKSRTQKSICSYKNECMHYII